LLHQTTQLVLPDAILHSLLTLAAGYSLAAVVALPLGFAMGRVAWVSELLHPALTGIYAIPPAAFKYAHRPQTQNLSFFQ
jgi:ABC-type nitrate/sulfonate/bicarbonate transport system permease component